MERTCGPGAFHFESRLNTRVARENAAPRKLRTLEAVTRREKGTRPREQAVLSSFTTLSNNPLVRIPRPFPTSAVIDLRRTAIINQRRIENRDTRRLNLEFGAMVEWVFGND